MNEMVSDIVEIVLTTAGPNIAILVAVALQTSIDASQHAKASEVEFSLVH